jgi:hypothetical protein
MYTLSLSHQPVPTSSFLLMCFFSSVGLVVVHGLWSSMMGFLNWFYVEAKVFELLVVEGGQFYI